MSEPISFSVADLQIKIAELLMECSGRAKREDVLMARIQELEQELAVLTVEPEKPHRGR